MRHATPTLSLGAGLLALALGAPIAAAQEARPAAEARAEQDAARQAAREYYQRENAAVRRRARIERLTEIYRERGDSERVRALEALRERDEIAHRAQLARIQERIGAARFQELEGTRRAEIAERVRMVQQNRQRAASAAATRDPAARPSDPRRGDARVADRPAARPAPRPAPRPDRPRR